MTAKITRGGWLAIGLAVVGSLVAVVNEVVSYRRSGVVDWGDVALALGVPLFIYAVVKAPSTRQGWNDRARSMTARGWVTARSPCRSSPHGGCSDTRRCRPW